MATRLGTDGPKTGCAGFARGWLAERIAGAIRRHGEGERDGVLPAEAGPQVAAALGAQQLPEQAVPVRLQALELLEAAADLLLHRHAATLAERRAAPDQDAAALLVGDEGEAERLERRLGPVARDRAWAREVQARLEGVRERGALVLVADLEPGDEAHAVAPHAVEALRDPALEQLHRHGARVGRVGVPAQLGDPELQRVRRDDLAEPVRGVE